MIVIKLYKSKFINSAHFLQKSHHVFFHQKLYIQSYTHAFVKTFTLSFTSETMNTFLPNVMEIGLATHSTHVKMDKQMYMRNIMLPSHAAHIWSQNN